VHWNLLTGVRRYAEECLSNAGDALQLKTMLESDQALLEAGKDVASNIGEALTYISKVVQVTRAVQQQFLKGAVATSNLYIKGVSGALAETPIVRELLLAIKKTPSDVLSRTFEAIHDLLPDDHASDLQILTSRLEALITEDESGQPLRSEHDIHNDTLRTTVVAQKVQLSRHKAKLSERDEAYSKIVTAFHDLLANMYKGLQNPLSMFGHEIMIYDQRMPHRAALMPKPRFSIERALSSPHDYLNCQCCGDVAGAKHGEVGCLQSRIGP
jgi:origin recognition complex subunit 3